MKRIYRFFKANDVFVCARPKMTLCEIAVREHFMIPDDCEEIWVVLSKRKIRESYELRVDEGTFEGWLRIVGDDVLCFEHDVDTVAKRVVSKEGFVFARIEHR